ncbi:MAG TPA: hypothetical protein VFN25_03880 [Dokdonella sp.]|uniref:hypothetical protein n=1 Tax=Dokdonella sp. TaxID=2291710 RepID=UPI002D7E8BBD|nr:hypothetical protein [Dokdonella sp.]HET9032027.1 hypothetical protein [Dokdonella sp.]
MIKYILLAAAWMLPLAAAPAQAATPWDVIVKESIDATQPIDIPTSPDGTATPSDLTLDTSFLNTGMISVYPIPAPPNATTIEDGLRVFPNIVCSGLPILLCDHRGYYVVARVKNTDGSWQSAITSRKADGTLDLAFGTAGWMYPSTHLTEVVDAAMASGRMYILSTVDIVGIPMMRVTCTDLATGSNCSGFAAVISFGATSGGSIRSAYARRIVYDSRYGLFIAGRVWTVARGWEVAIARLNADTGALVTEFRGDGTNIGLPSWSMQTNSAADVFDLKVAPSGTPGGERLYVAGIVNRNAIDVDGFVLGLNPNNGFTATSWVGIYYESDNIGSKQDAATAITVLRNGKVAVAGWSETDTAGERSMILGRLDSDGNYDPSFCTGGPACKRNDPWPNVVDDDLPTAIAERSGNRDLVIALKHRRPAANDPRPRQLVVQYSANGNVKHAQRTLDFPAASGVTAWSRPFGMWVGNIAPLFSPENEVVVVTGTRLYTATDYDATLSQMFANDSIFADQFGGPQGD